MPTRLILIRHGSTDWSKKKKYCGFSDVDLNDKGENEARKLYQKLSKEKIHRVYSSDSKRALHFARIAFRGLSVEKAPELRELNFGIFEGLTYEELMKKHPKIYKKWLNDPSVIAIPHGEDLRDFKKRVVKTLKKIIFLNKDKTIAVVCHGGAISIFINHILKAKKIWNQRPNLAGLSMIEYKNGKAKLSY